MNTNDYNPADDGNQGLVQQMAQREESTPGIAQEQQMSPVQASGPEPEKAEVNDPDGDYGINNDMLEEEEVEEGDIDTEEE
ncbi:hypothetical protein GO730_12625 [Spirosoma sp. HMF3257]|uniref:Uncharacterized protein n=1 Tax=Spirosoma telluris TaxID=2183553 RepID=A0A327NI68_9BACT|nr:hypothetical protein [Spirosoma telluris]RAI74857.1 hypothetical protein HMF3257_12535 [Spirosoma telluris]